MIRALALLLAAGGPAQAFSPPIPEGAEVTREVSVEAGARAVPTGPMQEGFLPTTLARGAVRIRAIRVPGRPEPATLLSPLMDAATHAGWTTLLSCQTQSCGGFDFRFALELIPPPDMFVDLSDFLYLAAASPEEASYVTAIASRSATDGYLHVVEIRGERAEPPSAAEAPAAPEPAVTAAPLSIAEALESQGRVVLEDLVFPSGARTLPNDTYPSLTELAAYLEENPEREIALVGHTDATGSLNANIAISRERAQAARTKLIERYGTRPAQVAAEGMGYLAPRTTNLTEEGREQNRRVEAILTSTRP